VRRVVLGAGDERGGLVGERLPELVDALKAGVRRGLGLGGGFLRVGEGDGDGLLGGLERGVEGLGLGGVPFVEDADPVVGLAACRGAEVVEADAGEFPFPVDLLPEGVPCRPCGRAGASGGYLPSSH